MKFISYFADCITTTIIYAMIRNPSAVIGPSLKVWGF